MNNTLGKHLLIDFYNCKVDVSDAHDLQPIVEKAFNLVGAPLDGIDFYHIDSEYTCIAVSDSSHMCIHAYPDLGYVAVDIYSFNIDLQASHMMSSLKVSLQSDCIKATSVRRGDFGSIRDLRPKRKTKITTIRRMKNTGAKLKKTSKKMFHILRHPQQSRRNRKLQNKDQV